MTSARRELIAALRERLGARVRYEAVTTPWCSGDLVGERHEVTLVVETTATYLLADLNKVDFNLAGHLVADIAAGSPLAAGGSIHVQVEALTFPKD